MSSFSLFCSNILFGIFQHSLFTITPPRITVCLSFAQIRAIELECEKYGELAQSNCGNPFSIETILKQRQEKRLDLMDVIAERAKINMDEWRAERDKKAAEKQKKNEKNRLELMQQIEEIRLQKLSKRREEVEADREYLRQCELNELKLLERENEQRRKNIEYYTELEQIVDAQQKRAETEIEELKSKLSCKEDVGKSERKEPAEEEEVEETPVNVDSTILSNSDDSDTESVYFDADKSPESAKTFQSPEEFKSPSNLPRSASDLMNSNVIENLAADRTKNRANVLNSNINLNADTGIELGQKVDIPSGKLSEAQKNKLKMLQQGFGLIDANANAPEETTVRVSTSETTELSDLQKNRNKVLSSEFGVTEVVVKVSTENNSEFGRNKKSAQSHTHTFEQIDNLNANKPMTDLQLNRQKVMTQEYGLAGTESRQSNELRNKLKASLSLDLDNVSLNKPTNLLSPKACQSDFFVSPMSTTSDELMASSMVNELDGDKISEKQSNDESSLKLDCSISDKQVTIDGFSAEIDDRPTPMSALNTAGLKRMDNNGFVFNAPYKCQPSFSQILRPSSSSSNIFDISPRLSATKNKGTPTSPVNHQSSKSLSNQELQDLSSGNLTIFLEQSFTIPFQVYSNILNNEILKIFFQDLDILSHFDSLRNYFFMMNGEFASNVCDGLLSKLKTIRKPTELLNSYTLNSILEGALQSSHSGNDKYIENLSFSTPNVPDKFEMSSPNVLNTLHLSYKVEWPLNLLLSTEAIEHYDKVFQHLLKLRRITWLMDECFYVSHHSLLENPF